MFQSTHPHGVRHVGYLRSREVRRFQSTHPHGVRLGYTLRLKRIVLCFNPRTHTGCDIYRNNLKSIVKGFNPRTHTGCDDFEFWKASGYGVSIHAPTRGATLNTTYILFKSTVSIHAPTRGATRCGQSRGIGGKRFQSTHPHGVRQQTARIIH